MKKTATLLALAAMVATSASARNLWSGSCTFASYVVYEGVRPVFEAAEFADAVVGDKLVFAVTDNPNDPQSYHQLELYKWDGEKPVDGGALATGIKIESTTTQVVYTIDESLLAALKENGFALAGTGYTVTSIDLTSFDGTLWQGECVCENWNATPTVNLPGSTFAVAKEGDVLVFDVAIITAGSWAAIQIDNGTTFSAGSFGATEITASTTQVRFTLTADLLAELKTYGINITGANFKLTRISLEAGSAGPTYGAIWEGECICVAWDAKPAVNLPGSSFAAAKEGDILVFDLNMIDATQYSCIQIDNGTTFSAGAFGTTVITETPTQVTFTLNADLLTELQTYGINITGMNFILTKISLQEAGGDEPSDGTIWTGEYTCASWSGMNLPGSTFADAKVGDSLVFDLTMINPTEYACIQIDNGTTYSAGAFGTTVITESPTQVKFTLNADLLAELKTYGINITGMNYTLTRISLVAAGGNPAAIIAIGLDCNNADNAVYNLRGVKVADALNAVGPGIYICNGSKYIVR